VIRPAALVGGLVTALLATALTVQPPARADGWRNDLDVFSRTLKSGQEAFAQRNDVGAFDAEIAALKRDANVLSDAEITLRLMKLVARIHDGHSHVNLPLFAPFRRLPLTLEWYGDELAVTGAAPADADALGLRVTRIGPLTPEQALAAAAPYIASENESGLRAESPGYLTTVELLQALGAADVSGLVTFTFARPDGTRLERAIAPGNPLRWSIVDALAAHDAPVSVSRRHREQRYYWFEYLPEARAIYVQYNRCENDPARPFRAFAQSVMEAADIQRANRWVVDLRQNGGGSTAVVRPLLESLGRARRGPVFVLIGGHTFSAAVGPALDLRDRAHATLVGEPTGGRPNGYGNAKTVTLPHSGLRVQYSTRFFRSVPGNPAALEPDVRVTPSLADVLAGRDPVLEAALVPAVSRERSRARAAAPR